METSNIRPIAILTSYLSLALLLSLTIIRSLLTRYSQTSSQSSVSKSKNPSRRNEIYLFSALAAFSLVTTWFYMLSFFTNSYQNWASVGDMKALDLGGWLRDSTLFKEAWAMAIGTKARFWWTQQIFSFTTLWSFFLGIEGHRHSTSHVWMFMLLGQIVAVSFATNLFLLSILVSQPLNPSPFLKSIDGDGLISFLCLQFLILPGLGSTAVLPTVLSTPSFMPTLLIPHLLLFVPPAICDLSSKVGFAGGLIQAIEREKEKMYTTIIVASLILQIFVTYSAVKESGFGGIKKALYEHPAASSVGWDVICCWVSWGIWGLVEG